MAKQRKLTAQQKQARAEYSRMRDMVRKRILRAQAKGELLDKELPPTLKELDALKGNKSIGRALARERTAMEKFIGSPQSTAKGRAELKVKRFEGYKKRGYDNITESNEKKFTKFMKHMIKKYKDKTPQGKRVWHDSDSFASFFDDLVENDKVHEETRLSDLVRMFNRWVGE